MSNSFNYGYTTMYTKSSLWNLCTSATARDWNCSSINFYPANEYSPNIHDSTMAILYTITKSAPFFVISAVILLLGFGLFILETCSHQHSISYFISGGLFIISGLLMLSGLIMYISIFKSEVGFKLRPKSAYLPRLFNFQYGQSFYLYIIGFICTELIGVVNVFNYISLLQVGEKRKIQCMSFNPRDIKFSNFEDFLPVFPCRKQQTIQPSARYSSHQNKLNPRESIFGYPQEFPITRTLSSTSDIIVNNRDMFSSNKRYEREKDQKSSLKHFFHGSKAKTAKEEELIKEASRKAGRNFNPHSIYYIEDNTSGTDGTIYVVEAQSNLNNQQSDISIHRSKSFQSNKLFDEREIDKAAQKQFFNSDEKMLANPRFYPFGMDEKHRHKSAYQSRTLPRDFLKRSNQFTDEFFTGRHCQYPYGDAFDNTFVHKSIDDFIHMNDESTQHSNHWPKCIPTSPSAISTKSHYIHRNLSDVNYANNIFHQHPRAIIHHVPSSDEFSTFDLDQIERERRKSHANLFDYRNKYDNAKSTPV
ncbi:uncharacterized protein LOC132262374 [Phlebotomus argentipes]|uniref:uncharacterized protein LOC132262374 n=1 Tax=Phlebotomus argentipes TaxID=94469 RepID=UPI002892E615|nr:uncharacterized protein LOC132262374 [Phlebotomus argentipes]